MEPWDVPGIKSAFESFARWTVTLVVYTDPMQRAIDSIGPWWLTSESAPLPMRNTLTSYACLRAYNN